MVKSCRKSQSSIEFFKVFLSSCSSTKLSFPTSFVLEVNQTVPPKATLEDYTGKIWDVELQKTKRGLIISKGWEEFVHNHSLVDADFLLFEYDGNTRFYVKVFDRNGLKKREPKVDKVFSAHVKEEMETEMEEDETRSRSTSSCKCRSRGSSSDFGQVAGSSGGNQYALRHATVTKDKEMNKASSFVTPKNPHFVVLMTRWTEYELYIHRSVMKKHNIRMQQNIKLRDEMGKLWPVNLFSKTDGRLFLRDGWSDFHKKHHVTYGDEMIFEFIPSEDTLCNVVQVQIIRKRQRLDQEGAREIGQHWY